MGTSRKKSDDKIITEHLKKKKKDACGIIDKILDEFGSEERIREASVSQLSSVMGVLIDKLGADEKKSGADSGMLQSLFDDFGEIK